MRALPLLGYLIAAGCSPAPLIQPASRPPSEQAAVEEPSAPECPSAFLATRGSVPPGARVMNLEYHWFGLAALDCDDYTISVGAGRAFTCCRAHCGRPSATPHQGTLSERDAERLVELATAPAFVRLYGNHHSDPTLIGGGGESLRVQVDERYVQVTLYNVEPPAAFRALRGALLAATGCRP
jgi:hypothetical protein